MMDGLRETSRYIHGLLTEAIEEVGAENVVLGGLSQGCAATLISLLTWEGEPLAAAFGMCGWLPLQHHMADIANPQAPSDSDDDPFTREDDKNQGLDVPGRAVAWLREEIDLLATPASSLSGPASPTPLAFQRTPVLLAHGTEDEKVKVELGRDARDCLASLGAEVSWMEYEDLAHWYSGYMLGDLVDFLRKKTGWTDNKKNSDTGDEAIKEGKVEENE